MLDSGRLRRAAAIFMVTTLGGCASISAVSEAGRIGSPKVYAGTRLDAYALAGNKVALRRFPAPPEYPLADLPLSFMLDTALLPLTVPAACYEAVFY